MTNTKRFLEILEQQGTEKLENFYREQMSDYRIGREKEVYVYLDDEDPAGYRLETFWNVGGNSWLDDDHISLGFIQDPIPFDENFNSVEDYEDYMEQYGVVIPEGVEEKEIPAWVEENHPEEIDKAYADLFAETWDWCPVEEAIMQSLRDSISLEEE